MYLKSLKLVNFRNFTKLDFKFENPVTILLGNNAQGKSNFLESIYFLSTTKSHKADADVELIKEGEGYVIVSGEAEDTKLEIAMENSLELGFRKRVKVSGIPRKTLDYIGNLSVVAFLPEDINLVTGSPSLRRWHIDLTLAQIDRSYKNALTKYSEVVISKNRVLKRINEGEANIDELTFWREEQLKYGVIISQKRQELFDFLNSAEKKFGPFEFEYLKNELTDERLQNYQGREIITCSSLIGPHRDDFLFKLGGRNLSKFGSRGEHRTAILDLKISEASFIESKTSRRPILLLDDVFSELDLAHRSHVLDLITLQQTVLAAVELDEYLTDKLKMAKIIKVENGSFS